MDIGGSEASWWSIKWACKLSHSIGLHENRWHEYLLARRKIIRGFITPYWLLKPQMCPNFMCIWKTLSTKFLKVRDFHVQMLILIMQSLWARSYRVHSCNLYIARSFLCIKNRLKKYLTFIVHKKCTLNLNWMILVT